MDEGYDYGHVEKPAYVSALSRQIAGDHYKKYKIQPAEYMHANNIPFLEGEAISYITRWRDKNGLSDVRKAIHILEILIQLEETKEKHDRRQSAMSASQGAEALIRNATGIIYGPNQNGPAKF